MFLKKLILTNFRNFSETSIEFDQPVLFIGKNAQGKSNILEAVYFLATTKSSRVEKDSQLIKEGESFCRVEGIVEGEEGLINLEIVMQKRAGEENILVDGVEKRVKVNGIPRRSVDYIGNLVAVYFTPEDINLVAGSPSLRRWHLDIMLAQIDRQYKKAISDYTNVVTSRNRILKRIKDGEATLSELEFWTKQLVLHGQIVAGKRRALFSFINSKDTALGNFYFDYKESVLNQERINQYASREIAAGTSLIGPHRDDFIFQEGGRDLAFYGSRGEQRTSVLNLKLAELQFIQQTSASTPVLLLDDVFSELDMEHREFIAGLTSDQQTLVSAVEGEMIPDQLTKQAKIWYVKKGKLFA